MPTFFNLAFLLYYIPFLAIACFTRGKFGGILLNSCGECGYSKEGLPAGTPCPECGSTRLKHVKRHTLIVLRKNANWKLLATILALVLLFALFGDWIMTLLIIPSYVRDGFRVDSAANVIRFRELARSAFIPDEIEFGPRESTVLVGFVLAFSPLLATLRNRKLAWWIFRVSISATLLFAILYLLSI